MSQRSRNVPDVGTTPNGDDPARTLLTRADAEALSAMAEAINSGLDLRRVLQTVTDTGTRTCGAEFGAFFYNERDASGEMYQLHVLSGAGLDTFRRMPQPRITPLFEPTFSGVSSVRIDDVPNDPRASGFPPGHLPVRSYLAVPVVTRSSEVIGALLFGHREPNRFDETSELLIELIAAQAAVAVENARLFAAEQAARVKAEDATARLRIVQSLTSRIAVAMTVEETLAALRASLGDAVHAARIGLFLPAEGGFRHVELSAEHEDAIPRLTFLADSLPNPVQDVVVSRSPRFFCDGNTLADSYPTLTGLLDGPPAAAVVVPLLLGDRVLGACSFGWEESRTFVDEDVAMFVSAAAQVAFAVERAHLFEAEHRTKLELASSIRAATETSRELQRSLLPRRLATPDTMQVAVRYQASNLDAEVGGDWYDVVARASGTVLVIGDVQGHNLTAAALMGQLRTGLHAYLAEGHSVEEALTRANHLMTQLTDNVMATCCLAEVDTVAGQLRVASAGHPSPICVTGEGIAVETPVVPGLPLGVVADARWTSFTIPIGAGDRVVLYTDGLVERRGIDIFTGIGTLSGVLVALAAEPAETVARLVVEELGDDPTDDIALLVCDLAATGSPNPTRVFEIDENDVDNVSVVRRQAQHAIREWALHDFEYTVSLIVSELVTNVYRHARTSGVLQLQRTEHGVRIVASDRDDQLPELDLAPAETATGGRGLMLIKALAQRWGVQPTATGKTIWAELEAAQPGLIVHRTAQAS